ncbi:MAG: SDR family NAD(P)-dependent oxidoreductase, partial [Bacteroidales bacterium]|nr:SDR family NAD(P)-dependent oxidoreductase [Bacteroidales bacterium]
MLKKYGNWALITGASSGIGKAFAFDVARQGLNLILVSEQEEALNQVANEITSLCKISAIPCCADLSDMNSIEKIELAAKGKEIGLLINDASYGIHGAFVKTSLPEYFHMINVNINAYVALTHTFMPQMAERKNGAIIMVSSLNAFSPIADSAIYTASKAFELYFGGALWQEAKADNIDVMVIMPGPTKTGFQERAGTKVNTMALTPEQLVEGAWPCLGKKMCYIPGLYNKLISFIGSNIEMEKRIVLASQIYKLMLHEKPESDLFQLL